MVGQIATAKNCLCMLSLNTDLQFCIHWFLPQCSFFFFFVMCYFFPKSKASPCSAVYSFSFSLNGTWCFWSVLTLLVSATHQQQGVFSARSNAEPCTTHQSSGMKTSGWKGNACSPCLQHLASQDSCFHHLILMQSGCICHEHAYLLSLLVMILLEMMPARAISCWSTLWSLSSNLNWTEHDE